MNSLVVLRCIGRNEKQVPEESGCLSTGHQKGGSIHSREGSFLLLVNFHVVFKIGAIKLLVDVARQ